MCKYDKILSMDILLLEDNETLADGIYRKLKGIGFIIDFFPMVRMDYMLWSLKRMTCLF